MLKRREHYERFFFFWKRPSILFTGEGGEMTSVCVCHRLAEPWLQGGAGRKTLDVTSGYGHAWGRTSTPWLYERQNPSRGRAQERVVLAAQCTARRNKWAPVETTILEEGPISYLSLQPVLLRLSSDYECTLSLYPSTITLCSARRFNNTNHGDESREAALAEKGSGLRLCLSSRRWAQNVPFSISPDRPSTHVVVKKQDVHSLLLLMLSSRCRSRSSVGAGEWITVIVIAGLTVSS